ncbi:hypothetical protein KFE25_009600 [Diacronema lutheri]|uniref:Uncharacterized protein n=1 Tax=Diacronema lutheri TaxID=2081491 RepID=A0A8J5XV29_DIALT|nr:hypothetical protein KFE25_009600 [Diacronema lutheri]
MLPAHALGERLLPGAEPLGARVLEHGAALAQQFELDPLTLGFRSAERERAYAPYRAALGASTLRGASLWLACAYVPLEACLEAWQHYTRQRIAPYAWPFALVAACALVFAFYASQGRGAHADVIGCALLVSVAGAVLGRAAYARVDPLAPPVALALLFFLGAGPPLLGLRFVAAVGALVPIAAAHGGALALQRAHTKYAAWYELGALLAGLVALLTCRALERAQRAHFCCLAALAALEAGEGPGGTASEHQPPAHPPPDGALALLDDGAARETDAWRGAPTNPLDDALRDLRDLAHRLQTYLPHARVPTDVVEQALGQSGASSLAELLLRHTPAAAHAHAAVDAGSYLPPALGGGVVGGAPPPLAGALAPAADAGALGVRVASGARADDGGWAAVAAARAAGAPIALVTSDALPGYFAPYAHVLNGYRCELSARACVRSLFKVHNETLNVWTELLPAAAFGVAIVRFVRDDAVLTMPPIDRALLVVGLAVALVIRPLCSGAAHLFYCAYGPLWYTLWWSVDYVSICAAILAVSLVCARNAFYCEPELAHLFFVCSSGLLCTSMIAVLFSASSSVRAFSFLLFVLFCNVVPLCYQLFSKLGGFYHNDAPWAYIYFWVASLATFFLGLVVKSTAVPEAFAPGRFDLVGSSHQLWHVCINVAFVLGTLVPWRIYADWRAGVPCPAPPSYDFPPPSAPPALGLAFHVG